MHAKPIKDNLQRIVIFQSFLNASSSSFQRPFPFYSPSKTKQEWVGGIFFHHKSFAFQIIASNIITTDLLPYFES